MQEIQTSSEEGYHHGKMVAEQNEYSGEEE
jgi:hypothetical protein